MGLQMPKWFKLVVAICLLPVCAGAATAALRVIRQSGAADETWVPFLAGVACWIIIYVLLPRPMWVYVFGHELTHALWTWLFGGRVKKFKTSSTGGHVIITKTNFLIALAPYFFPLYAALTVLVFVVGDFIWNWQPYLMCFHLALGGAYAFHVSLTGHVLQTRQSDITSQGYLFSAVVIFLGNVIVLLVGVPLLANRIHVTTALLWWLAGTEDVVRRLGSWM